MTFADLFAIIHKHIVTAVVCFVTVVAVACRYAFLSSSQYSATAQIIATYKSSQDGNVGDITQQSMGAPMCRIRLRDHRYRAAHRFQRRHRIRQLDQRHYSRYRPRHLPEEGS
ncbi:Wzz/FepE/Etk N-terminal domain-containing protein [Bifidobacterium angulatum]|uniref:Wzz/FepE/Etk N-terminal domain-containing protein n=1 Tax=Bifidobacterium angulatum TaxID=1683 RepID=UPI003AB394F3